MDKDEEIDISQLVKEEEINDDISVISRKYISEIINARVEEVFKKIDGEFKAIDRSGMLPAGVIFVGGGANLDNIVTSPSKSYGLPAAIGQAKNINVVIDKVRNPEFLTALGLVIWGSRLEEGSLVGGGMIGKKVANILDKTKKIFGKIMPR